MQRVTVTQNWRAITELGPMLGPSESMRRPYASMVGPYHAHHRALPAAISDIALSMRIGSHLAHKLPYCAPKHSDMAVPFDEQGRALSEFRP